MNTILPYDVQREEEVLRGLGLCPVCGSAHTDRQPHDLDNPFYRARYALFCKRLPTAADAYADCGAPATAAVEPTPVAGHIVAHEPATVSGMRVLCVVLCVGSGCALALGGAQGVWVLIALILVGGGFLLLGT